MAVSTQQLAEELQIFGLDCEDALMGKRESRTAGVPSKFHVLVGYRLGPKYTNRRRCQKEASEPFAAHT